MLICGGRVYQDRDALYREMDNLHAERGFTTVIAGGAVGADTFAEEWGHDRRIACTVYHADWETHGRPAGPIRNQQMLDEGKPDLVVAFPGGKGTADMVRRARDAGVEVIVVGWSDCA